MRKLLLALILLCGLARPAHAAFTHKGTFTVTSNAALLPSTQTDFPVLVSLTNASLKTIANSGNVADTNGYDIRFYSDSGLTATVPFQLEFYAPTTGQIVFWVKISSLALNTVFYCGYGDAALNTNASSTSTWDSNFKAVYHLANGSSLTLTDGTSNAATLTNNNAATATAGKLDGGVALASASTQYLSRAAFDIGASSLTVSVWVNSSTLASGSMFIVCKETVNAAWEIFVEAGDLNLRGGGTGNTTTVAAPSNSTWHHIVGSISGTTGKLYVDGVKTTGTVTAAATGSSILHVGRFDNDYYFNGSMDELQISNTARSDDWVTATFNNQNDPTTFVGSSFASLSTPSRKGWNLLNVF